MSDQQPPEPPDPNATPYGNPPPPPATNPYAAPTGPTPAAPPPQPPPAYPTTAYPPVPPPPGYTPPPAPPGYHTPPPPAGYAAPTYAAPGYVAAPPGNGGLAIGALVVAIVSAVLFWLPILDIGLPLVGLILGIVAWAKAGRLNRPKGMAIAATIVAALTLLAGITITVLVFWLGDVIVNCNDSSLTQDQVNRCLQNGLNDKLGVQT